MRPSAPGPTPGLVQSGCSDGPAICARAFALFGHLGFALAWSGSELRVYPLYYLPLSFGAWLKTVNDQRGHDEGDDLLRAVANVLEHGTRTSDIVARLGGDEFVLVFPDTGREEARVLLERLRLLLAETPRPSAAAAIG